jgi:hypothetical protein
VAVGAGVDWRSEEVEADWAFKELFQAFVEQKVLSVHYNRLLLLCLAGICLAVCYLTELLWLYKGH